MILIALNLYHELFLMISFMPIENKMKLVGNSRLRSHQLKECPCCMGWQTQEV